MYSEYESDARRAAVEAVERRWERQNGIARKARRTSVLRQLALITVLGLVLCGAVLFTMRYFGYAVPDFVKSRLSCDETPIAVDGVLNVELLDRYCQSLGAFVGDGSSRWRDAPDDIKPKTAKKGKVYQALIEHSSESYDIYEITTLGDGRVSVALLSPHIRPISVKTEDFSSACSGKKYFIAYEGVVYACGKATVEDVNTLSARLRGCRVEVPANKAQ